MIVTEVQRNVLSSMVPETLYKRPRGSLERLEKKGLVSGDRRGGWRLTRKGMALSYRPNERSKKTL